MDSRSDWRQRLIFGAAGGFVGTLAIQALLTASQKWLPNTVPPLRQDPGEFMVKTGEEVLPDAVRRRIPPVVETGAVRMLAVGYGLTFGALYTHFCALKGAPHSWMVSSWGSPTGLLGICAGSRP